MTLLIQALFKSYDQCSLVCFKDNIIMPCFSYRRMIKINSTPFVISDKKWPTPFNMSEAPLSFIIGFPPTLEFIRTFIESSSKQMNSHQLFLSRFQIFRLIKYRIVKCIPFNVADVAKKEFREER